MDGVDDEQEAARAFLFGRKFPPQRVQRYNAARSTSIHARRCLRRTATLARTPASLVARDLIYSTVLNDLGDHYATRVGPTENSAWTDFGEIY